MATRARTRNHSERASFLNIVDSLIVRADVDEDIKRVEDRLFRPEARRWESAYTAHRDALRLESVAAEDVAAAEEALNAALRVWAASLRGADGRSLASRLTALFGGKRLEEIIRASPPVKAARVADLLARLPADLARAGDPAHLASLEICLVGFKQATDGAASLGLQRLARGRELAAATVSFDEAAGRLGRALTALLGRDGRRDLLPAFSDVPRRKADSEEEADKKTLAGKKKAEESKKKDEAPKKKEEDPKKTDGASDKQPVGQTAGAGKVQKILKIEPSSESAKASAKEQAPAKETKQHEPPAGSVASSPDPDPAEEEASTEEVSANVEVPSTETESEAAAA